MKHLNILLMSIILFAGYINSALSQNPKWRELPGAPTAGSRMDDVFFTSPYLGWVIAANCGWWECSGEIWKTTDGGQTSGHSNSN